MRKSVKRAAIIAVSALLAMSMAGCAKKKDPKELYTEAIKKNQELSSMDMSSVVKMTMSQGEETIDVDVDMDIQMADVNTDKMKYVAKGSTSLMGQSIETSMFYTDGYYYMDMMGQKMKYAMDMDKLMEQVKQTTDNGNLNVEYMKDIQAKKDGDTTILTFSAINVFYARRYAKKENAEAIEGQVTKAKPKASRAFVEAIPALLLPVIILGGIYGGFFTATEAAGVCSVLALLLGALVYRQLKVKNTMDMLKTTASSIGSIFMMIFFCLLLSQCMTQLKIPQMLVDIFLGFTNNKFVVLIMVNVFLLFVGMIVNDTTAIMLCAPLLMPLLTAYGVNPIHFGALMIVNLSCGCLTPPYASVLYFGMKVGNAKFGEMMKNTLVFLLVGYVPVMLLTTYVEAISLFLPRLLGYA